MSEGYKCLSKFIFFLGLIITVAGCAPLQPWGLNDQSKFGLATVSTDEADALKKQTYFQKFETELRKRLAKDSFTEHMVRCVHCDNPGIPDELTYTFVRHKLVLRGFDKAWSETLGEIDLDNSQRPPGQSKSNLFMTFALSPDNGPVCTGGGANPTCIPVYTCGQTMPCKRKGTPGCTTPC